jgi:hypothetical protein
MRDSQRFLAMGQLCHRFGQPYHRIAYVIRSRCVQPVGVAGHARLFDEEGVGRIEAGLREVDARRASVQPVGETRQAAARGEEPS